LYNPRAAFYTMPLALLAIGSHLDPARYRVVIVDGRLEDDPVTALAAHLDRAVCLGVTVLTGRPIRDALAVSRALKARRPDLPVVWGGWHPSMFGTECLTEPTVDATVQGQGEATFTAIVEALADAPRGSHPGAALDGLTGTAIRRADGSVHRHAPRPIEDINTFRQHDYNLLPVERYFDLKGQRQLDYISSQGCPFRCAFCADPFVYQRKWFGLSAERVGDEITDLWDRYRFDDLAFQDETFFTYPKRIDAIARAFIDANLPISWSGTLRADQCERMKDDVFERCVASGMRRVLIGVESGDPAMLVRIRKDITLEQIFAAAARCRDHGVATIFPFIVGFPDETERGVQMSMDVAKELRALAGPGADVQTPFFFFKPYPGSPLTHAAVAAGHKLPTTLEGWADFEFTDSAGPWVSETVRDRIERFTFYLRLAFARPRPWLTPLQRAARWRLDRDRYDLPVERWVGRRLRPDPVLT
ncbi:MAG: radical SAM protein, partial [Acidobacteriota bacterium]